MRVGARPGCRVFRFLRRREGRAERAREGETETRELKSSLSLFSFPSRFCARESPSYRSSSGLVVKAVVPERAQGERGQVVERGRRGRDGRNQPPRRSNQSRRRRGRRRRQGRRGRQRVLGHVLGRQRGHVLILEARDGVVGPRGQASPELEEVVVVVGDEGRGGAGTHRREKFFFFFEFFVDRLESANPLAHTFFFCSSGPSFFFLIPSRQPRAPPLSLFRARAGVLSRGLKQRANQERARACPLVPLGEATTGGALHDDEERAEKKKEIDRHRRGCCSTSPFFFSLSLSSTQLPEALRPILRLPKVRRGVPHFASERSRRDEACLKRTRERGGEAKAFS